MNRQDQELLDKQLRGLNIAPRHDGIMILALLAMFFTGMALGGFFYAYTDEPPVQVALNDALPVIAAPQGIPEKIRTPEILRQ